MTKKLKGFLITIFSAVMILSALFVFALTPRTSARADGEALTPNTIISKLGYETKEGGFSFDTGADIMKTSFHVDEYEQHFYFNMLQAKHANLFKYPNSTDDKNDNLDSFGQCIKEEFAYKFTLLRGTTSEKTGSKADVVLEYYIIFGTGTQNTPIVILERDVEVNPEEDMTFANINTGNGFEYDNTTSAIKSIEYLGLKSETGFDLRMLSGTAGGLFENTAEPIVIILSGINPAMKYSIRFDYVYHNSDYSGITGATYNDIQTDSCKSQEVSFIDVLTKAKNSTGGLEAFFDGDTELAEKAESLIAGVNYEDVTIIHQKRIKGTPFAEKVETVMSVPVWGTVGQRYVELNDVRAVFGNEGLETLNASIQEIKRIDDETFEIEYHYSGWLRLVNNDGKFVDVFASMNESFEGYFYQYVQKEAMSRAAYSYIFQELIREYPALNDYSTRLGDVYGLWGMLVLPNTYTLDDLAAEFFQPRITSGEHVTMFTFTHGLTYEEYQQLQANFEYGWVASAWNTVAGFVAGETCQATYHIVYLNPEQPQSWLDLRGDIKDEDDMNDIPDGGIIGGTITDITGAIGGFFGVIVDGATGIIGGIGDLFSGMSSSPLGLVGLALIAVAVIVIIRLIKNGTFGGKRK